MAVPNDDPTAVDNDNDATEERSSKKGGKKQSSNGFKALGLSDGVYRNIVRMGFKTPTPVQRKALPVILTGVDAVVMARTGSGKTCAFLIPLIERLIASEGKRSTQQSSIRGIVLSPTRELSLQTLKVLQKLSNEINIKSIGIHGAENMEKQFALLASRPDVIVATPGRLAHHLSEIPDFTLSSVEMCILDEADRLLEMGFAAQLRQIGQALPNCQKVLLSATMPKMLVEFTKSGFVTDPSVVRLDHEASLSADLRLAFVTCRSLDKDAALLCILQSVYNDCAKTENSSNKDNGDKKDSASSAKKKHKSDSSEATTASPGLTLIFAATRHHVEYLHALLGAAGYKSTYIYGTLDQQARIANLAAFRQGRLPILIVTDVAARGIDVPLIDHVIHYHFPPSAKLFVHRSGRAARAGRIGYGWGLVEPDELPYMIELHLFIGRKPSSGDATPYAMSQMTPEMVHFGSVPESILSMQIENVQRFTQSELSGSLQADQLQSLIRVCKNSLKQYRRTRPEASRDAVRKSKAILEGERLESGQRLGGGHIPAHPLLQYYEQLVHSRNEELQKQKGDNESTINTALANAENMRQRQDFLVAMSQFRPKETIFEAFATGKNKSANVASHVDKGRTTSGGTGKNKHDSTAALSAMRDMRRQMRMARDKGSTLIVAGSEIADNVNNEGDDSDDNVEVDAEETLLQRNTNNKLSGSAAGVRQPQSETTEHKRRMSKAERKRIKKNAKSGTTSDAVQDTAVPASSTKKDRTNNDFRDPQFYIDNDAIMNSEEAQRSRQIEAAMQPSAASAIRGSVGQALRMEEAMMDIVGDEKEELVKKQRLMRWDKAKRKYVQTTVGAELSGDSKSKKMRLESGQMVKTDKLKLGELYQKWQKKTNMSIGRNGVFDDEVAPEASVEVADRRTGATKDSNKAKNSGRDTGSVKTLQEIQKDRKRKEANEFKNMKRTDRKRIVDKRRKDRMTKINKDIQSKQKYYNKKRVAMSMK